MKSRVFFAEKSILLASVFILVGAMSGYLIGSLAYPGGGIYPGELVPRLGGGLTFSRPGPSVGYQEVAARFDPELIHTIRSTNSSIVEAILYIESASVLSGGLEFIPLPYEEINPPLFSLRIPGGQVEPASLRPEYDSVNEYFTLRFALKIQDPGKHSGFLEYRGTVDNPMSFALLGGFKLINSKGENVLRHDITIRVIPKRLSIDRILSVSGAFVGLLGGIAGLLAFKWKISDRRETAKLNSIPNLLIARNIEDVRKYEREKKSE